jgi:peptidoglycan/xylan/chitin deacetylase (PgdA/CDA1 family)
MTFEPGTPLRYGSPPLPTGNGLAGKRGQQANKPYSGVITLSPDQSGSDVGYVVFKIDGGLTSMANTQPFKYVWDTAKVSNGSHKVEIIVYDKAGQIMDRAQRDLRTSNADAPASQTQDQTARSEQIKSVLWQALTLRPSRHMLAFTGAEAARSAGDMASMQRYLEQAAALEPDYKDTRSRLNALNHCIAEPALWRGASNDPVVALTFDDGPKPGVTEMLLNVLTSEKVPATFFVIGRHATANPDLVKKISDAGMQIENHSYTHPNLTILPTAAVERELLKTIASVRSATGKHMRYFRPPGGNLNNEVTKAAAQWGLTPCMWTVDGESLENGTPDRLIEYVLQHAGPGAIILLHNGRMTTIEALPRIIEGLRKRGLGFVTIDQLAERKTRFGLRTTVTGRG